MKKPLIFNILITLATPSTAVFRMNTNCHYTDGNTAKRHNANAYVAGTKLIIVLPDAGLTIRWTLADLHGVDETPSQQEMRIRHAQDPGRLLVVDAQLQAALKPHLKRVYALPARKKIILGLSAMTCGILGICILAWPQIGEFIALHIPIHWEQQLGKLITDKSSLTTCQSAPGKAALNKLTARISPHAQLPFSVHIDVVDTPEINAFALPGGSIQIYRGLIEAADSADEVAGVLAHEMAHVSHRHGLQSIVVALGWQIAIYTLMGDLSQAGQLGARAGQQLLQLSYSRDKEREADANASATLRASGISSRGLQTFFARLGKQHTTSSAPKFLSTHPRPEERVEALAADTDDKPVTPALNSNEWAALKSICSPATNKHPSP